MCDTCTARDTKGEWLGGQSNKRECKQICYWQTGKHAVCPARHKVCSKSSSSSSGAKPSQAEGQQRETANAANLLACESVCVAVCVCVRVCVVTMPAALLPLLAPFASDSFIHCTDRRSLGRQSVRLSLPLPLCPPLPTALSVRAVAALRPHWHGHASQWQPTNLSQVVRTVKKYNKK